MSTSKTQASNINHFHLRILRLVRIFSVMCFTVVFASMLTIFIFNSGATGSSSLTLSPLSGNYEVGRYLTLNIFESSSVEIDSVQAGLNYNDQLLKIDGVSCSNYFNQTIQASGGAGQVNLSCATDSTLSGKKVVGSVNFIILNSGDAAINFEAGSAILTNSQANTWNGIATGGIYKLNAS